MIRRPNFWRAALGDIAVGAATRMTATARRLALATMDRIETEDWLPARRDALSSMLKTLSDPVLKVDLEQRLGRWLPARPSYLRASLIQAFGAWKPTPRLQDLLLRAMNDEDPGVQRSAAAAYAKAFSPSTEAPQRLIDGLARKLDLSAAAALLESLALGWPGMPEAAPMFEEAWHSHNAELRLIGILGLAATGAKIDEARDVVLRGQSFWADLSYPYRNLAAAMLRKYWPDDDMLVKGALESTSRNSDSPWEPDVATAYLLESGVDRGDVRAWILAELEREFPFNVLNDEGIWSEVGRFAAADPKIRAAANAYWCEPKNRLTNLHNIPRYVVQVADPRVAAELREILGDKNNGFDRYWALTALLAGWGRNHLVVKTAIDELADGTDDELADLASLLPEIVPDKAAARERLLRMSTHTAVRRDLLAIGFAACGCGAADNEAVAAILAFPERTHSSFDLSSSLFRAFATHADVRALALASVGKADAPLGAIAVGYANDREFEPVLFDAALPLPVDLRTQVIEVAASGATGTALETVLGRAMLESDPELRVRMVIAQQRVLPPEEHSAARQAMLAKAAAVGPDYESVRAAALAGLATIGALDALASLKIRGKPVEFDTCYIGKGIASVERLICERFADFEASFGSGLAGRFNSPGDKRRLANILSAAPGASPAARAAFLALAERGEIPQTPQALRALAAECPCSDLLLARCWDTLEILDKRNDRAMVGGEVGLILREHFHRNECVHQRLVERFEKMPVAATALPLAIFAPDAEELPYPIATDALGQEFADWALAVHVAACRADSVDFLKLLEAMVTRRWRSEFDAQKIANLAVEERLRRDSELEALLSARIGIDVNPSVSGSSARYLAAAGKLSPDARRRSLDLLQQFGAKQCLPIAGYDAIADQWRVVRATLLDALSAGLELV